MIKYFSKSFLFVFILSQCNGEKELEKERKS